MNRANKLALIINLNHNINYNIISYSFNLKALFFHSTPVLDRRKRHQWESVKHVGEDGEEVETIFHSAFGGKGGYFVWSFKDGKPLKTGYYDNNRISWYSRPQFEDHNEDDEDESSSDTDKVEHGLVKDRIALGLSGSGPLSLEDVKDAYRTCALKWHPDHHEGSSKAIAEEKFKVCNAAYQSLCDKLTLN